MTTLRILRHFGMAATLRLSPMTLSQSTGRRPLSTSIWESLSQPVLFQK